MGLSINLLNNHPRERTPSSCKDHAREEKCTDISDQLQVSHTVTPSHMFAPRDASSNKLVVVVTAVVTRSNHIRRVLLTWSSIIKSVNLKKKKKNGKLKKKKKKKKKS